MSQQHKLEKVLDLLLSEDQDQAAELLHQIIVEKARGIYESIVDEEADIADAEDEFGGDQDTDFTDEISSDEEEIDTDEENGGEPEETDEFGSEEDEESSEDEIEDRVEDLESQLSELRAEFDALMGEEMQEPNHADLAADMEDGEFDGDMGGMDDMGMEDEMAPVMYEKKADAKLKKAPEAKDAKKDKKVDEETQFLSKVADTGQSSKAKLAGTGKNSPLGAEQTKSPYTTAPSKADHGGKPVKIGSGTGGEYGTYNGDTAKDETPTDNTGVSPKSSSIKADTTPKFTGGKVAGQGFAKSPLTKKPA